MNATAPKERRTVITRLQLVMFAILKARQPLPARAIADKIEVSTDTVRRDIEALRDLGFQTRVEFTGETSKGFSIDRCNCPFCGSQLKQN